MKSSDAPGFLAIGSLMTFLPAFLPAYFPATGLDGTNASALWLEVMGAVNSLIGIGLVARVVPAAVSRMLAWRMPVPALRPRPVVAVRVLRPALQRHPLPEIYRGLEQKAGRRLAA